MKEFIPLLMIFFLSACAEVASDTAPTERAGEKITVVATFYPLAEFAGNAGGKNVEVITIVPAGTEPHDYEPTPRDIARIRSAKIVLLNGSGLDPWAEKMKDELQRNGITVIRMNKIIADTNGDPHFWLDPVMAQKEVEIIRDALITVDPENKADYEKNSAGYLAQLTALDEKFRKGLAVCGIREFVASHEAFSWLAQRYSLTQTAITGLSTEEEPSPRRLGELAKETKEKNIKYIFFETLVSPRLAETLAREIGAQTLVLNPLEGLTDLEIQSGKDYVSVMEENLNNLRIALRCT